MNRRQGGTSFARDAAMVFLLMRAIRGVNFLYTLENGGSGSHAKYTPVLIRAIIFYRSIQEWYVLHDSE